METRKYIAAEKKRYALMRLMKQANPLSVIGRAVINVLESGCEKQILESKDFKILGK